MLHSSEIKTINCFIKVSVPNITIQHAEQDSSLSRLATEFTTGIRLPTVVGILHCTPYPRRYPYFEVVVGLVWSKDPESCAGGSVVTGKASHAGQVESDDPGEKGYSDPPGWGLSVGLTTSPSKRADVERTSEIPQKGLIKANDLATRKRI